MIRTILCLGAGATRKNIAAQLSERSIDRRIVQIGTMRQIAFAHGRLPSETRWIDMGTDEAMKQAMRVRGFEEVSVEQAKELLYGPAPT